MAADPASGPSVQRRTPTPPSTVGTTAFTEFCSANGTLQVFEVEVGAVAEVSALIGNFITTASPPAATGHALAERRGEGGRVY